MLGYQVRCTGNLCSGGLDSVQNRINRLHKVLESGTCLGKKNKRGGERMLGALESVHRLAEEAV